MEYGQMREHVVPKMEALVRWPWRVGETLVHSEFEVDKLGSLEDQYRASS